MSGFDDMGMTNNYWGICGVNSALYGLYQNNIALRARLEKGAITPSMMLAEMKTFLRTLQADGQNKILDYVASDEILKDITTFTQSFSGFENFTIESYISRINSIVTTVDSDDPKSQGQTDLLSDPKFSIGLPPDAVVYYLKRICGFDKARLVNPNPLGKEAVVGLYRNDGNNMQICNGLRHWVYYLNGVYYSWGKQFASIGQMKKKYGGVCYQITF